MRGPQIQNDMMISNPHNSLIDNQVAHNKTEDYQP